MALYINPSTGKLSTSQSSGSVPFTGGSINDYQSSAPAAAAPAPASANSNGSKNIVNPGSVYQTYDPKTGKTTYGAAPEGLYSGVGPSVETPANLPEGSGQPMVANAEGKSVPLSSETAYVKNEKGEIVQNTENKYEYKNPSLATDKTSSESAAKKNEPVSTEENVQSLIDLANSKGAAGIAALLQSGRAFNETDAKNYASFKGDKNWQQYVGGSAGQANPLYIGSTAFSELQKKYTPYQIQQATIRNSSGIYWNPNVNIAQLPAEDPTKSINKNSNKIADILTDAKSEADVTTRESEKMKSNDEESNLPDISAEADKNEENIMNMLQNLYSTSAEDVYKSLFDTPEINDLKTKVNEAKKKVGEYDQQMSELKDDIRKEVEGEAPESYITALATIRGNKILRMKTDAEQELNDYTNQLTDLKSEATNLMNARIADNDNRYNRLFSFLQLQLQQEGQAFDKEVALANIGMNLPEGRSITLGDGTTIKGIKENDNLNVISFTDSNRDTYAIAIDKKTGATVYKTYIGKSPAPAGASVSAVDVLNNYLATQNLQSIQDYNKKLSMPVTESGAIRSAVDRDQNSKTFGKTFYYDANAAYSAGAIDANGNDTTKKKGIFGLDITAKDLNLKNYLISYSE